MRRPRGELLGKRTTDEFRDACASANAEPEARVSMRTAGASLDQRSLHDFSRIRRGVVHMSELAEGLLALARLSQSSLRAEPGDLAAMARNAIALCREREPQRRVVVDIAASLPVTSDPRLLAQVMENLLGNAWKFLVGASTHGSKWVAWWGRKGASRMTFVTTASVRHDMRCKAVRRRIWAESSPHAARQFLLHSGMSAMRRRPYAVHRRFCGNFVRLF